MAPNTDLTLSSSTAREMMPMPHQAYPRSQSPPIILPCEPRTRREYPSARSSSFRRPLSSQSRTGDTKSQGHGETATEMKMSGQPFSVDSHYLQRLPMRTITDYERRHRAHTVPLKEARYDEPVKLTYEGYPQPIISDERSLQSPPYRDYRHQRNPDLERYNVRPSTPAVPGLSRMEAHDYRDSLPCKSSMAKQTYYRRHKWPLHVHFALPRDLDSSTSPHVCESHLHPTIPEKSRGYSEAQFHKHRERSRSGRRRADEDTRRYRESSKGRHRVRNL